jgi:hypothetical protein
MMWSADGFLLVGIMLSRAFELLTWMLSLSVWKEGFWKKAGSWLSLPNLPLFS